ncbi:sulfite exporter TauE/SafE family protein [Flavobacterium sedimenticola]|uniref:Probable membrane transporter protein n=1 Tax=Flavobacterium sedimenticola TaxID=3043286 RepID=A0ABT6XS00_9FLAO|nr:sulfite exporter TauE/SafE family protein [Flavobacterium sedimenticola]MDI9257627.1 sulfite exporter TauE/SafE family protein [Flavobacterium sedimenticola]
MSGEITQLPLLLLLLAVVAFLYASVGHGGASGYLALMSIFGFSIAVMKPTALVLNILVSGLSFYFYFRAKEFHWKLFYPFAIISVPFSFLGGTITIETHWYKIILGTVLLFAIARLLGLLGAIQNQERPVNLPLALFIGAVIGFLSGLIGIGGGIILSPVLLLLGWATIKQTAAVSALFILVNSVSGLFGFVSQGGILPQSSIPFIGVVLVGGILGGYFGSKKMNTLVLRNVLALVLGIAVFKLYTT